MMEYKVFQFYVPHSMNFDNVVKMFKYNKIKVDDMCSTTRDGRVINIWLEDGDLDNKTLEERCGAFL